MATYNLLTMHSECPDCGFSGLFRIAVYGGRTDPMIMLSKGDEYPWWPHRSPAKGGRPTNGTSVISGYGDCPCCGLDHIFEVSVVQDEIHAVSIASPGYDSNPMFVFVDQDVVLSRLECKKTREVDLVSFKRRLDSSDFRRFKQNLSVSDETKPGTLLLLPQHELLNALNFRDNKNGEFVLHVIDDMLIEDETLVIEGRGYWDTLD